MSSSLALLTDFYQLTMAYGYWKNGIHDHEAVYHLYYRKNPFGGGYAVAAGLEQAVDFIQKFRYDKSDLEYLASLNIFPQPFLDYLSDLRLTCDIDAVPEGTVVFPQEPLIRVKGPLLQAQLLESPLLNQINFPTLIATKSARVCLAAAGDQVMEFGLRRAQGMDGALTASRAAYIGGCHATSNVLAGKRFGIPVQGTQAHSWVMAFEEEEEAFTAFADALADHCVFLVDTYNSLQGVEKAIRVAQTLKNRGKKFLGIRLDSGDLAYLSIVARQMLDDAGFKDAKIIASNELDEQLIADLKQQGAKIAVWGVGTKLAIGDRQGALDGIYKLTAIRRPGKDWEYKIKLSEQLIKVTNPGIMQVRRYFNEKENLADVIFDLRMSPTKDEWQIVDPLDPTRQRPVPKNVQTIDLLQPIFRAGKLCYALPSLPEIRDNTIKQLKHFHGGVKRFVNPHQYVVGMEKNFYDRKAALIKQIREKFHS